MRYVQSKGMNIQQSGFLYCRDSVKGFILFLHFGKITAMAGSTRQQIKGPTMDEIFLEISTKLVLLKGRSPSLIEEYLLK
jgi:hypothetical protein